MEDSNGNLRKNDYCVHLRRNDYSCGDGAVLFAPPLLPSLAPVCGWLYWVASVTYRVTILRDAVIETGELAI
jgi:hypothetical protein